MANITLSNYRPAEVVANNALSLPVQTIQPVAISGSNGSYAYSTLTMGNLNGISHYTSNGSVVASYTVPTTGGISVYGNTTGQSSGSTNTLTQMNVSAVGAVSAGWSSNTFIISGPATSNFNQVTVGVSAYGNTTGQSSSSNYSLTQFNISAAGIVSAGWSNNSFIISAPGTTGLTQLSAGMSNLGNTAGTTGMASQQLVLVGGNNITLSGSTAAGGLQTVSIIGGAGGGGGGVNFGVSTAGNTAGATGTVSTGNVVLVGNGAISLSQATGAAGSAATITINAPAVSSLVGNNGITVSTNGSTINVGNAVNTDFYAPYDDLNIGSLGYQIGQGSLIIDPQPLPTIQFDRVLFPIYNTNASNSSGSHTISASVGIYSRNNSTLALVGSGSVSTGITHSGTVGSYSLYSGMRNMTISLNTTLSGGNYWLAFGSSTSSAGNDGSYYNIVVSGPAFGYGAIFGQPIIGSNQIIPGQGIYTSTTNAVPASVPFSQIYGNPAQAANMQVIILRSGTI